MNIENLNLLPDGKTEYPATVVINKMGANVVVDLRFQVKIDKKETVKQAKQGYNVEINRN